MCSYNICNVCYSNPFDFCEQVEASERPYRRLVVKEKEKILTDGLEECLDWEKVQSNSINIHIYIYMYMYM